MLVEPLDAERTMDKISRKVMQTEPESNEFPKNYATLCDFSKLLGIVATIGMSRDFHTVPSFFFWLLYSLIKYLLQHILLSIVTDTTSYTYTYWFSKMDNNLTWA